MTAFFWCVYLIFFFFFSGCDCLNLPQKHVFKRSIFITDMILLLHHKDHEWMNACMNKWLNEWMRCVLDRQPFTRTPVHNLPCARLETAPAVTTCNLQGAAKLRPSASFHLQFGQTCFCVISFIDESVKSQRKTNLCRWVAKESKLWLKLRPFTNGWTE